MNEKLRNLRLKNAISEEFIDIELDRYLTEGVVSAITNSSVGKGAAGFVGKYGAGINIVYQIKVLLTAITKLSLYTAKKIKEDKARTEKAIANRKEAMRTEKDADRKAELEKQFTIDKLKMQQRHDEYKERMELAIKKQKEQLELLKMKGKKNAK